MHTIFKTVLVTTGVAVFALTVQPVFAVNSATPAATTTSAVSIDVTAKKKAADDALAAYKAAKTADKLAKLHTLGDALIDHRLATVNQFVTSLTINKTLTADQITTLKTLATTTTNGLTALRAKIDADTVVETAKADVKSIFDTYHVYAVLMPKLHLTTSESELQAMIDKLNSLTSRIQKTIDAKKAAGVDTTALSTALTDFSTQLIDAAASVATAKLEIAKMNQMHADISKAPMMAARDALTKARASLVAARGDLTTIRDSLKSATSITPPASATTTTTPAAPATK